MNKILVIGDSCTDIFVYGDCYRLNPEAPTPVLSEHYKTEHPGMAANVVKNVEALGFKCDFLTQVEKITKTRYVDEKSNYILLRIDNDTHVTPIRSINTLDFSQYDLVIISDYDKGFLHQEDLELIFKQSKLSFFDTKKPLAKWMQDVSFIKINEVEYNNRENDLYFIFSEMDGFKPITNDKIIITLGELGARYKDVLYKPLHKVTVRDVVGAGDTFLASLACHYYVHKDIIKAIEFANLCSGQVVSKKGIAYPDAKL